MLRSLLLPALCASAAFAQDAPDEPTALVRVLYNGDFAQSANADIHDFPWWRVVGRPELVRDPDTGLLEAFVRKRDGLPEKLIQPLPAYGPLVKGLRIRGRMRGTGLLTIADGLGGIAPWSPPNGQEFEVEGWHFEMVLARPPQPRLSLELSVDLAGHPDPVAAWSDIEVMVELPCPDESALRAEVLALVRELLAAQLERGLDTYGPLESRLWCRDHDARTGQPLGEPFAAPGVDPVAEELLRAWRVQPEPEWELALDLYLRSWLEIGFHPDTGLPRAWDPVRDVGLDAQPVELHRYLRFLVDLAEFGPEAHRERALERARVIGELVLERGVLPNDRVAAVWVPVTGAPADSVPEIRVLHLPAGLARLGALLGDERYRAVARDACLAFEYTHHWPGDWQHIDPGMDDTYGNIGWAGVEMWRAWPEEEVFARLPRSGYDTYAPLWEDCLRYGGNVAADQVRCWRIFRELGLLDEERLPRVRELLLDAARSHFRGEQGEGGAWTDVTIVDFDPKGNLGVGDTGGMPQNLLRGLAMLYDPRLGLREDPAVEEELRAMFTTVLRSTLSTYREPEGFRDVLRAGSEGVSAFGGVRLLSALVEMLGHLDA